MKIRALFVEDNPDDVELVLHELHQAGYDCAWKRVDTPDTFRRAILDDGWDVILADFTMPRFTAPAALEILKETGKDIPFIIVSGSVGEHVAVEAMKAGAHDFFPKGNLPRLAAAVDREIRESKIRFERHHAVEQLRGAEERYRLILESVRDYAIFMLDHAGAVASWNAGAERLMGYTESEILGKPLASFYPEQSRRAGTPEHHLESARERGSHVDEGLRVTRDGTEFWASCTIDRIVVDGSLLGYSSVVRDISEKKRLLDGLRQAVRARDEFLSIASHELKTPLTSLELQLERLRKLRTTKPELRVAEETVAKKLDTVERQAERLTVLINNLLDVTRITSGRLDLHREAVDLGKLARTVVARMRGSISRAACEVSVHADEHVVGDFDRLRLETVMANLLSNALKFGAGKRVDICVERNGSHAQLRVTDRGIGISEEQQARIFERFERAVPQHHYGGFGLGLWIVRQLTEAHGGSVRVHSKMGEGSTFTVELPIREEQNSA